MYVQNVPRGTFVQNVPRGTQRQFVPAQSLLDLDGRDAVVPGAARVGGQRPCFQVAEAAPGLSTRPTKVAVGIKRYRRAIDLDGRNLIVEARRQVAVGLAGPYAKILAAEIDVLKEAGATMRPGSMSPNRPRRRRWRILCKTQAAQRHNKN